MRGIRAIVGQVGMRGTRAPLEALLAVLGLCCLTALSIRELPDAERAALKAVLVVIWCIYAAELAAALVWRNGAAPGKSVSVIDLLAVAIPAATFIVAPHSGDASLSCALWLLKPLRDLPVVRLMGAVLATEGANLLGVLAIFLAILFAASLGGYVLERNLQPEQFGSIPKAMWWGVVTLTTTGYGDEIPRSFAGRLLAGMVMMSGIGVFALWAGILASGFSEQLRREDFLRKWQLVSAVPLFRQLGPEELLAIVRCLHPGKASPGAVLCRKGEKGDRMFFIVDGHVGVATAAPVELGPGSFFGEMALITGEPRNATVVASTQISFLSLNALDFHILASRNSQIAEIIRKTALERRAVDAAPR
jgi:voltage-gated potassium channel